MLIEFKEAAAKITGKIKDWVESFIEMTPNIAVALLVVILFGIGARLAQMGIRKINKRIPADNGVMILISNFVFYLIIGLGVFMALSVLHLDKTVTSLLAGAGIIGLALGFAFQETAANFLSGVLMTIRKPIAIGDLIESQGIRGIVKQLNLRATIIETPQGQNVLIPNKSVFYNPIFNFTVNGRRRIDLEVGISYGEKLREVEKLVLERIGKLDGLLPTREVQLFYTKFDSSSINFVLRLWTSDVSEVNFHRLRSEAIKTIKDTFDENGITIPFPIRTLDFGIKGGTRLDTMYPSKNISPEQEG